MIGRALSWMFVAALVCAPSTVHGGFLIDIVITGSGNGDVIVTDGAGILVNASATTQFDVNAGTVLWATGKARDLEISVTPQDVIQNQALQFSNYQISNRSVWTNYSRISGGGASLPGFGKDTFTVNSNTQLMYEFEKAADGDIRQYQYFLGVGPDPTQANINEGLVYSSTPLDSIAWDVFKDLEFGGTKFADIGNSKYGVLRVLDWGGKFDDFAFEFDISPSGGSAVPEPSSVLLISATALAGWIVKRKRYARRKADEITT